MRPSRRRRGLASKRFRFPLLPFLNCLARLRLNFARPRLRARADTDRRAHTPLWSATKTPHNPPADRFDYGGKHGLVKSHLHSWKFWYSIGFMARPWWLHNNMHDTVPQNPHGHTKWFESHWVSSNEGIHTVDWHFVGDEFVCCCVMMHACSNAPFVCDHSVLRCVFASIWVTCVYLCLCMCVLPAQLPVMRSGLGGNFLVLLSLRNASCCRASLLRAVSTQLCVTGVA